MWLLCASKCLKLYSLLSTNPTIVYYTASVYYTLNPFGSKYFRYFAYSLKGSQVSLAFWKLSAESKIVRFKYVGKAYRISKRKHILHVNMHYPTYKYVIWLNIKLKHSRKKKRSFEFKYNTLTNIRSNFYKNILKLRMLNTYTVRGIHNNLFEYYNRKTKTASKR